MVALPVPRGSSITGNAGGNFFPRPGPSTGPLGSPTRVFSASNFVPRKSRYFGFTAEVDMGNLMTLGVRWEPILHERLTHRLGEAAGIIVERAKAKLFKPGGGIDTGRMYASLHHALVSGIERGMVAYDLEAGQDAYYWVFVEFGHMTVGGNWWPGYHFLSSTLMENDALISAKVRIAMAESVVILGQTARIGAGVI
jgi:hypothetical protein